MNTEMEDRLALSLQDRAERDVDSDALLTGALRKGRQRQVRRRAGLLGVTVLLITGVVAVGTLRPYPFGVGNPADPGQSDLTPRALDDRLMPAAAPAGTPTALQDPAVVGTDPGLLHLGLGPLPGHYAETDWKSGGGTESVTLFPTDGVHRVANNSGLADQEAVISLISASAEQATIAGETKRLDGTFTLAGTTVSDYLVSNTGPDGVKPTSRLLRWQPAPGVSVEVQTENLDDTRARLIAAAVRLNTVNRCSMPFQLTQPPVGTATDCELTFTLTPVPLATTIEGAQGAGGTYTVNHGGNDHLEVEFKPHTGAGNPCGVTDGDTIPRTTSTVQLDSGTARAITNFDSIPDSYRLEACQPIGGMVVNINTFGTSYPLSEAVRAMNGLRAAGQLDRPDTWPASPLP